MRTRAHRLAAAGIAAVLLASGCTSGGAPGSGSTAPVAVTVPDPPPPAPMPQGTPRQRAQALADATDPGSATSVAGWLTAYDALGVPVVSRAGAALGTTQADPLAIPYWQVWYAGVGTTVHSDLRLSDFARYLSVGVGSLDAKVAATALLADLRADASGKDAGRQLLAYFVADKARNTPAGVDPLSPKATADEVAIDAATAWLLATEFERGVVSRIFATTKPQAAGTAPPVAQAVSRGAAVAAAVPAALREDGGGGTDCSNVFGGEDNTKAINTILQAFAQGASIPGTDLSFSGLIEQAQKAAGWNSQAIADSKSAAKSIGLLLSILDLLIQVQALSLQGVMEPDPLERTHSASSDGNTSTITLQISSDPDKALAGLGQGFNSADFVACASKMFLSTLGVSLKLPKNQVLKGAEVDLEPRIGIGDYVVFDMSSLRLTTNANGEVTIPMKALKQKKTKPDSAHAFTREFSFVVSSQIEATDINSIISTFIDGFKFGNGGGNGSALKGVLDVLKTTTWDLGEWVFNMKDWFAGWRVDGMFADYHFTGQVCSLERPFTLQGKSTVAGIDGTFTVTPSPDPAGKSGTYSFSGTGGVFPGSPGRAPVTATGHIDLQKPGDDPAQRGLLRLDPGSWLVHAPYVGTLPLGPGGRHLGPTNEVLDLVPDDTACL